MERKKASHGLRLNAKKGKAMENSGKLPSPCMTPVTKKSSSLYKDVLKESVNGKSRFNSDSHTRQATSPRDNQENNDEFNFRCSFDSDDENLSDVSLPLTQPVTENKVLQGVVAYIDVRTNTENRFEGISKQMELLGAVVVKKFIPEVTHVIFKDGKKSTRDKAIKKGIHLVNILWVENCRQSGKRVSENHFPVTAPDEMITPIAKLKRTKSMQPRSFEEDLRDSTEKVNRRRRRREAAEKTSPLSSRITYHGSAVPFSLLLGTSPVESFTDTPVNSVRHDLGDSGSEMLNRLKSRRQANQNTNNPPKVFPLKQTPTSPKAAPLDILQTASGPGKKRKRNKSRDKSPKKSDDSERDKKMSKKVKIISKTTDRITYNEEAINIRNNDDDCGKKVEENLELPSKDTDQFMFSEDDNVKTNKSYNKPNRNSKGSKREMKLHPTSKEHDVFAYTEEEVPEIKTTRTNKTSRSKSLSKRKSSLSTNEAEGQQTGLKSTLTSLPKQTAEQQTNERLLPVEQEALKQAERNTVQERVLSDSGIYLSEVEVNDCKTSTNSYKRKRIHNKSEVRKVLDEKDQSAMDDVVQQNINRGTDSERHSLHSQGTTEQTESSPNKKGKKRIKKSKKRIIGNDEEETASEEDKKSRKNETSTEITSHKKAKQRTKKLDSNGEYHSDKKEPSASEVEEVETSDSRKEHINDQQTDDEDDDDDGSDNHNEINEKSNNTTEEFQEKKLKPRKKIIKIRKPSRSLVLTSMHFSEQGIVVSVIRKLGGFYVTDKVSTNTTHVVSGVPKRTLNVLLAIAQGCWLISPEWAMKSLEAGYWIDEEPYELSDSFPSAQLSRLERASIGPDYQQELFTDVEPIYVCDNTSPPRSELVKLITLCGGQVCTSIRKAGVCVGNINRKANSVKVSETWVIESITEHTALPFSSYIF